MVRVAAVHSRAKGRRIPEFETSLVYTGRFKTAKATEENPEPKQTNKNLNKQQNKQNQKAMPCKWEEVSAPNLCTSVRSGFSKAAV